MDWHHGNAPESMLVREFLAKNKSDIMNRPKLKTPMKEKRFTTIEEIKEKLK